MRPATEDLAAFVGGFVAAEGYFRIGSQSSAFAFAVGLGAVDLAMCETLHAFFGAGSIHRRARRRPHYDDEATFQVRALGDLVEVVVPFMDEHLPPSHKRDQYRRWRQELLTHSQKKARRRRTRSSRGFVVTTAPAGGRMWRGVRYGTPGGAEEETG